MKIKVNFVDREPVRVPVFNRDQFMADLDAFLIECKGEPGPEVVQFRGDEPVIDPAALNGEGDDR
ncbi:hypothetical protein [Rhodococcus sp. 11-3]|uniref:hypothetical protein n=1 Tax=Rhodococcus sp. 11-3 TaxID=2854796 RepID=UPI002040DFC8|nr:hypothetical protein [Rhodococcus sp. 11-3]USC17051.1 hypothetical protein KZJ41_09365 [Rhodococcus sp. 11-3]